MDRRRVSATLVAAAWMLSPIAAWSGRGLGGTVDSDGGTFRLALQPPAGSVPLNELFELQATVTLLKKLDDPNPLWLNVETTMPGHGHGMNTRARVEPLGDGRFAIRGILLHMSGEWEFTFDIAKGRTHEKAVVRFVMD